MPDITDTPASFVPVTRVETTDLALGGNEVNVPNKQFKELARRDRWLRTELETLRGGSDAVAISTFDTFKSIGISGIAQGRLTVVSGSAVAGGNQVGVSMLYYTPYSNGNQVALWNSTNNRWDLYTFAERTLNLAALAANTNHDIFLFDNAGTLTLQAVAWSNSAVGSGGAGRASSIFRKDGAWVKTSDLRRYLGTIRTTNAGQTEDSETNRFVWNVQNRVPRIMRVEDNVSHTYTTNTARPYNNDTTTNRFSLVTGLAEDFFFASVLGNAGFNADCIINFGLNTTASAISPAYGASSDLLQDNITVGASHGFVPNPGFNFLQVLQQTSALGTSVTGRGTYFRMGGTAIWNC